MSGLVQIIITAGVIMIYGSTGLQPSSCPVSYRSFSLYLKTFLWCLYNMTEHHLTTTVLIVGHTLAEIPKWVPYLFKKSLFYPHLFTLYPSLHTDGKSRTCPALDRVVSVEIRVLGAGGQSPVSSVSVVCIRRPHLAAPCHHHTHTSTSTCHPHTCSCYPHTCSFCTRTVV